MDLILSQLKPTGSRGLGLRDLEIEQVHQLHRLEFRRYKGTFRTLDAQYGHRRADTQERESEHFVQVRTQPWTRERHL